jgi:phosphoribosylaminoimidazolecarboxamide formyltransferase/IMP cyclohydrolase
MQKRIQTALISIYHKEGFSEIASALKNLGISVYTTGGTLDYLHPLGVKTEAVEELTGYPSILGGRVKTLHPAVFGGILARRNEANDLEQLKKFSIPTIDLVVVDLYPFEETVASSASHASIIEKIDIGGISLIRAGAKNHTDTVIIGSKNEYADLLHILTEQQGETSLEQRQILAAKAFQVSSHYDSAIFSWFQFQTQVPGFKKSVAQSETLRYGENPHQKATFYGDLGSVVTFLNGKQLSYNNLLDLDAALQLIQDFSGTVCAIIKHNNACGLAVRPTVLEAWHDALAGDPVSAFGGIIAFNSEIDLTTAQEIDKIFYEILVAPSYAADAMEFLKRKEKRIILQQNKKLALASQFKSLLDGVIQQDYDTKVVTEADLTIKTQEKPSAEEIQDLLFANLLVKHTKSNAIVLVKNQQLIGSGTGQTSRIDALKQAIHKAKSFGFDTQGAVLASDAFFPFADSVEEAHKAGIQCIIQPGGSVKDEDSINYCNQHHMKMVFTGHRHFRH